VLVLDASLGMPAGPDNPLRRVQLAATAAGPLAEAVLQRNPVWIGSDAELARRCPQLASSLPFVGALAAAPLVAGTRVWGALLVLFSQRSSPALQEQVRGLFTTAARCLAVLLRDAAEAGQRLQCARSARLLPPTLAHSLDPAYPHAAADFLAALPEGACRLDLKGRTTFVDHKAADLLGESIRHLLGALLWEAVPWLAHAPCRPQYQAALASQLPTSFTTKQPDTGRELLLQLYPDPTGVSLRISASVSTHSPTDQSGGTREVPGPAGLDPHRHMMHLSGGLAAAASVDEVVGLVAGHLLVACRAQAFAFLVAEEGRVRVAGHHGFSQELVDLVDHALLASDLPLPGLTVGAPSWRLAQGVPSLFADRDELRAVYPESASIDDGLSAWAWLPLMASGQCFGVCVVGYRQPRSFASDERATLTTVSALISQSLDRARQYDAKNQLAEGLQASLLPRTLRKVHGLDVASRYLPASHGMQVGGDFYDLIRVSDTEAAAVIGDVQGHGVSAAGLMGEVRTAVHAYAVAGAPPGEVLARTNHLFHDLDTGLLASCLYVHIDPVHHIAELATAGHCPPLLRQPDLRTDILTAPPGPLLGVDPSAEYASVTVPLPSGALLTLYTDGLIETPGIDYDTALASLAAALSEATGSPDHIADTLVDHAQPTGERADDTALLLVMAY
jgi:GAF domain-containing protein